jgi:ATP-dependent 26S proteasome regulatory subunit
MSTEEDKENDKEEKFVPTKADKELADLVRARYNLIYVVTWEEKRVIQSLGHICKMPEVNVHGVQIWDAARGLHGVKGVTIEGGDEKVTPESILDHIAARAEELRGKQLKSAASRGPIYVLCDMFRYLEGDNFTPEIERKIRVLSTILKKSSITVVMTSPVLTLPTALEKCVTVFDYPLPGKEQLTGLFLNAKTKLSKYGKVTLEPEVTDEMIVRALQGLTIQEAEDAIAKAVVSTKKFDIPTILEIKRDIIRKGGLLDYIAASDKLSDIGGFAGVKEFVRMRKDSFSDHAREYGLRQPKGIFLVGVMGTGKSLCAKAVANEMGISMLKMDMGSMFGSDLGASEHNMRKAISQAESIAPCVLFVDEIDKALAGAKGQTTDSGTTKRVIGKLLNWMQEKEAPVFIVACANSVTDLPAELMRKGRFDELFFVDFPTPDERGEIFKIHLSKRNRDPKKFDIAALVERTDKYSGAEIEGVIDDAMHIAYADNKREFETKDILRSIKTCRKLADLMKDDIDALRHSAKDRFKSASDPLYLGDEDDGEGDRFDEIGSNESKDADDGGPL